jgi:peptidoglycan L-alanyl-D-glutamate endopeptidase CwlK
MPKFGRSSKEKLATCHDDLQLIMQEAVSVSDVDFGISEGFRTIELQQKYFNEGRSKIDGVNKKGKHNYSPSLASDIYAYVDGKANYEEEHLSYLAGLIHGVSEMLLKQGKISHRVRWGGNWDMDGTIILDQTFQDRPHFELVNKS